MGRYDFRPASVLQSATRVLETSKYAHPPPWFDVIRHVPPSQSQTVVRDRKRRKRSKIFQPLPIQYQEDTLRSQFFNDHPWELARPKVVLEEFGDDSRHYNWEHLKQPGKRVDGESVIQRQLWLMRHQKETQNGAYDIACKEFYAHRLQEDTERRIAREEASHYGAYFGKGPNEIGMELEDKQWELWKAYAVKEIAAARANLDAAYSGTGSDEDIERLTATEEDAVIEDLSEVMPKTEQGLNAQGGAAFVPASTPESSSTSF